MNRTITRMNDINLSIVVRIIKLTKLGVIEPMQINVIKGTHRAKFFESCMSTVRILILIES